MIFKLLLTVALSASSLEHIKVELFEQWSEENLFPMVSFGLPTQHEMQDVESCLDDLLKQLNVASGQALSEEERLIELPFLNGMVAGLLLGREGNAELCLKHLEGLDDVVYGFSSSKMWRMRLQAYVALQDYTAAQHAAQELRSLRHVSTEDQTVLALFEISQLLTGPNPNIEDAVQRFKQHDQSLIDSKHFRLRDAFACGALNLMQSHSGKKQILISRHSLDAALYQSNAVARNALRELNSRLETPVQFLKSDDHPVSKALAYWNDIESLQQESAKRVAPLIELALAGNHEASATLLSTYRTNPTVLDHIDLLFDHTVVTNDRNVREYWTLQRAIHCINNNKREEGLEYLYLIPESSTYAEDAKRILRQIHELNADVLMGTLKQVSGDSEACTALAQSWNAKTKIKVARELLNRMHASPDDWHLKSIEAFIGEPNELPSYMSGEFFRLLGDSEHAQLHFKRAIDKDGETIETLAGLADVTRNADAMKRVVLSTSQETQKTYWYWLANLRLIEWHLEDGGSKVDAIAKVNRLRKMDASLGGTHFQNLFNELCE